MDRKEESVHYRFAYPWSNLKSPVLPKHLWHLAKEPLVLRRLTATSLLTALTVLTSSTQ
jgi:hypothetical protein